MSKPLAWQQRHKPQNPSGFKNYINSKLSLKRLKFESLIGQNGPKASLELL